MNHKIIADVVFAVIALGAVLALASRLRKPGTCRQRLAASLTIGAVLATVACAVMDTARHAALAAGHRPVLPQLAAGWVVITLAVGLVVYVAAAVRAEARADRAARAEAAAATSGRRPARARGGRRGDYGYGQR